MHSEGTLLFDAHSRPPPARLQDHLMEFLEVSKDRKDLQVVVVCGRNEGLKQRLLNGQRLKWRRRKLLFWKKKATVEESGRGDLEIHALR